MAIIKKYIMPNVASARTQFKLGDFTANVEFKDGDMTNNIPASLVTNDPRVQMAIETNKDMFGHVVFLEWSKGNADTRPVSVAESKTLTLEDVKTIDGVKAYLVEHCGVARNISSIEKIKAKVEEFGLEFPNFKFE